MTTPTLSFLAFVLLLIASDPIIADQNSKKTLSLFPKPVAIQPERLGGRIFYTDLGNDGMGFFKALGFCYLNNLKPAILTSESDDTTLSNFINSLTNNTLVNTRPFWLSLNDIEVEGTFQWVGIPGGPLTYTNWAPGSPTSGGDLLDCVSAQQLSYPDKKWGWINLPCSTKWRPLCQDYN